jgi:N-methylhydantoinase A
VLLMQSNGGLTTDGAAAERPMHIIESGPAGGVVGAQALARAKDLSRIITFDMGGTTAKASIVEDGEVTRAQEYSVGAGIMIGSRLLTGAGYMLKVPAIDLAEVGAGGGSHVWIDPAGALQIGPESAGAAPGPVCYDKGGETPTITDANLLLGYINPRQLVGGALKLNAAKARKVFAEKIAAPLRMSVEQAAHGAHLIAASNMIRAIKAVSTERGRDPRAFALFAFGGNGPVFACGMAAALGMKRVVVPPSAGLFSSFGLLYADVEHHYSRTLRRLLRKSDPHEIQRAWDELAAEAARQLEVEGYTRNKTKIRRAAALHYHGQTYELTVPLPDGPVDFGYLEEAFGREHEKTYGHRAGADEPVELVSIQLVGQGLRDGPNVPARVRPSRGEPAPPPPRPVYFGSWVETPVMRRSDLAKAVKGPVIVEEYDATCVIPPAARASLDAGGNIVVDLE